ncbi:MAG: hypothetical protein K1X74_19980 [Pirellulales bacterium]|nr:hypothetical protein [Pirellulales bacterium]
MTALRSGRQSTLEAALEEAARRIDGSAAPVLSGFVGLTNEAQREAALLAVRIGAAIRLDTSSGGARAGLDAPDLTATWSAAAASADLVIYWGADPDEHFPRHRELFAADRMPDGLARRVVRLARADLDFALRLALALQEGKEPPAGEATDVAEVAGAIRAARHAHVYLLGEAARDDALRDVLGACAARLRPAPKLSVATIEAIVNARGAVEALTWLTGAPGSSLLLSSTEAETATRVWLPSSRGGPGLDEDLRLEIGRTAPGAGPAPAAIGAPRIVIGDQHDDAAEISIRIPGLDPRLAATVVRGDGVFLTLCGNAEHGQPDPAVELLRQLRLAVQSRFAGGAA